MANGMTPDELKTARQRLGMTQAQLASALGLSSNFISMMERGEKDIEIRTCLAVNYLLLVQAVAVGAVSNKLLAEMYH